MKKTTVYKHDILRFFGIDIDSTYDKLVVASKSPNAPELTSDVVVEYDKARRELRKFPSIIETAQDASDIKVCVKNMRNCIKEAVLLTHIVNLRNTKPRIDDGESELCDKLEVLIDVMLSRCEDIDRWSAGLEQIIKEGQCQDAE